MTEHIHILWRVIHQNNLSTGVMQYNENNHFVIIDHHLFIVIALFTIDFYKI